MFSPVTVWIDGVLQVQRPAQVAWYQRSRLGAATRLAVSSGSLGSCRTVSVQRCQVFGKGSSISL